MITRRSFHSFLTLIILASAGFANAQDDKSKLAMTDLSQVDEDFQFQGEYVGDVVVGQRGTVRIGLQVVALGDGQFQAVEYPGGLPNAGWIGHGRVQLAGSRTGNSVRLDGYPLEIILENGQAHVAFAGGNSAGILSKFYRSSPAYNAAPPAGADVLFNGTDNGSFKNARVTSDGLLMVGAETAKGYQNFRLHVEFLLPYMPHARGQGRANSGVYLSSRYEVQILDSFGLEGEDNEAGALYRFKRPDVNMCLTPLTWQTYDIEMTAAKFNAAGAKTEPARLTVRHNGVLVHNNVAVTRKTGGGAEEGPNALPLKLQDHGNPVLFRNIWIVDYDKKEECECCCVCNRRRCCCVACDR